ncbi:MAG: hypothetical protein ACK4WK_11055, partial [Anaerolineae bacterium]
MPEPKPVEVAPRPPFPSLPDAGLTLALSAKEPLPERAEQEKSVSTPFAGTSAPAESAFSPPLSAPALSLSSTRYRLFLPLVARNYEPGLISFRGGSYTSPDGKVRVEFPVGAVTTTVRLHYAPVVLPVPEGFRAAPFFFNLEARRTDNGEAVRSFRWPVALTVRFSPDALPPAVAARLRLYHWDETARRWEQILSVVDVRRGEILAWTTHFSTFGVLADGAAAPACTFHLVDEVPAGGTGSGTAEKVPYPGRDGKVFLTSPAAYGKGTMNVNGPTGSGSRNFSFPGGPIREDVTSVFPFPSGPITDPLSLLYTVRLDVDNTQIITHASGPFDLEIEDRLAPLIMGVSIWQDGEGGALLSASIADNCALKEVIFTASSSSDSSHTVYFSPANNGLF